MGRPRTTEKNQKIRTVTDGLENDKEDPNLVSRSVNWFVVVRRDV